MNIQEAYRPSNMLEQYRKSFWHRKIKMPNALNKEIILRAVGEKEQVTYKDRLNRITPAFSPETMKARNSWADLIQTQREHICQPRILYSAISQSP